MAVGDPTARWERLYRQRRPAEQSWYQEQPAVSLALLEVLAITPEDPVLDVGGGASLLVDHLIERGFCDLSVIDLSQTALDQAGERLEERGARVAWLQADVLAWAPERRYRVWHDRAVFHFLVEDHQRRAYLATLRAALVERGCVVIGTFAADGPETCSGLPLQRYGPSDLAAAFGADFAVVAQHREVHHTPNGTPQPFTWLAMAQTP